MKIVFHKLLLALTFFSFEFQAKDYKSFDEKTKKHRTQKQKEKLFESVGCKYSNQMTIDPEVEMISACESQYFKDNKNIILSLSEKYKNIHLANKIITGNKPSYGNNMTSKDDIDLNDLDTV